MVVVQFRVCGFGLKSEGIRVICGNHFFYNLINRSIWHKIYIAETQLVIFLGI